MGVQNYPSSSSLIITFLENVKRYRANRINGMNPTLINFNGEQIYVYIRNLSPAQLSNDNPDIWRIQLPKREEFEVIKRSDKKFFLFGYDYIRKVYTTWNPYWCKQRLNVAESCSMYSRYSLQKRVADLQKIEVMQLQNEGNVVCIPSSLLGSYISRYKEYYPEESVYIPVNSTIQKRKDEEQQSSIIQESYEEILFEKFKSFFDTKEFQFFLQSRGYKESIAKEYVEKLSFVFEKGYLKNHADLFLECISLKDYIRAINTFCDLPEIKYYEDRWGNTIMASLRHYLVFVERKIYGIESIRIPTIPNKDKHTKLKNSISHNPNIITESKILSPKYELDVFGKLRSLDSIIIDQLLPLVRGIEFPDYNEIIKKVREYYPPKATEKMTPADWLNLFDSTKWQKKRGRKSSAQHPDIISKDENKTKIEQETTKVNKEIKLPIVDDKPEYLGPTIEVNKLKTVFDKRVTSYKYFWFVAILGLVKKHRKRTIAFSDILIRMVAQAWPIIFEYGIDLGEKDMMANYLKEIQKKSYLIRNASSKIVESSLSDHYKLLGVDKIVTPLLNNVPYRFLSPWIKFTNNEEVIDKSKIESIMAPYALYPDCIVINTDWYKYFIQNYDELYTFTLKSFVEYAKQYNNNLKFIKLLSTGWSIK